MSNGKLFYNDNGRVLELRNEEIAHSSWIRKRFSIELVNTQETLFLWKLKSITSPTGWRLTGPVKVFFLGERFNCRAAPLKRDGTKCRFRRTTPYSTAGSLQSITETSVEQAIKASIRAKR